MTPAEWFHKHGVGVFPLIPGTKQPEVSFPTYICTSAQAAQFRDYGVRVGLGRLGYIVVVDTDNADAEAWAGARLPDTPFKVHTARGHHRYYQATGPLPKFIHRDGHTIESRNQGQYVVGPGSVHASGVIYTASEWSWRWQDIPPFPTDFLWDDRPPFARGSSDGQPLLLPETIHASERHETLHRVMRSLVARCVPLDGALAACHLENLAKCRPPLDDHDELDRFLRRAYEQKDRADFVRTPQTAWDLAGGLIEIGLSVEATLVAVRSVTPDFDPNQPEPTLEPDAPTDNLNLDAPGRSI